MQGKIADMRAGELRSRPVRPRGRTSSSYDPGETNDRSRSSRTRWASSRRTTRRARRRSTRSTASCSCRRQEARTRARLPLLGLRRLGIGTTDTYKALFDWGATERCGSRRFPTRATRAPNTAELFQGGACSSCRLRRAIRARITSITATVRLTPRLGQYPGEHDTRLPGPAICAGRSSTTATRDPSNDGQVEYSHTGRGRSEQLLRGSATRSSRSRSSSTRATRTCSRRSATRRPSVS